MSVPASIEVDEANGLVRWRDGVAPVEAEMPGACDARYDPVSGRMLVLARQDGRIGVEILSREGERLGAVAAPAGYAISHFADEGSALVCQGEAPDEGWWDWHFEVDAEAGAMRRTGPVY